MQHVNIGRVEALVSHSKGLSNFK